MDEPFYKEHILEQWRNPRNKHAMQEATFRQKEFNTFCGDEVELFVKLADGGTVEQASFEGAGCAISQAAASLFTEEIKGGHPPTIMLMGPKEMEHMLGIALSVVRMRCALLPLRAFQEGWKTYHG